MLVLNLSKTTQTTSTVHVVKININKKELKTEEF